MKEGRDESPGVLRGGLEEEGRGVLAKWQHDEPLQRQRGIKMEKKKAESSTPTRAVKGRWRRSGEWIGGGVRRRQGRRLDYTS